MAVFRVNKTNNYTVMSNFHLKDKRISLKAKGLLSLILSLPDNWNYTIGGLVAICLEKDMAVKTALSELKKYGYLRVDKIKPSKENGGRYEYIYNIFEQPNKKQATEIQGIENQPLEIQGIENQPLYKDINLSNTDLSITNIPSIDNKADKPPRTRFVPPTLQDVQAYCMERNNNVDAQRFIDYYTSNGWKVGKNPMKDWKAAVRNWERTSTDKQPQQETSGNPFLDMLEERRARGEFN